MALEKENVKENVKENDTNSRVSRSVAVYLAHNFAAKKVLETFVPHFNSFNIVATSRWVTRTPYNLEKHMTREGEAMMDKQDIDSADAIIFFTDQFGDTPGRGKFWELGYAYGHGKLCVLVGEDMESCVFYHLPTMVKVKSIEEAIEVIRTRFHLV